MDTPQFGARYFSFVYLLNSGLFDTYQALCKVHSKASPNRADGAVWRRRLVADILGAPAAPKDRLERFVTDSRAGLWVANGQLYQGDD